MMSVCFKEKVQIAPQALDEVIAGTNCDIRQILNNLSMWSSTDKKLNADQVKADANAAKKIIKLVRFFFSIFLLVIIICTLLILFLLLTSFS